MRKHFVSGRGSRMKSCIFLDIDGTLLDHDIGIQESSRTAIAQAQANGHKVCLATGRPKPEVDDEIQSIPFDGCIYSCGAMVESKDTQLFNQPLSKEMVTRMISLLQKYTIGFNLEGSRTSFLDSIGYSFFHSLFQKNMQDNSELAHQYMAAIRMHSLDDLKEEDTLQIMKIATFITEDSRLREFDRQLPPQLKHIHHGNRDSCMNGEIYDRSITKATGIDCLLSHFHIPLEAAVAIGDSLNDAEMLSHCHIGAAMGNACEELKQISDMITTSSKEDGIYNCLKSLKLI